MKIKRTNWRIECAIVFIFICTVQCSKQQETMHYTGEDLFKGIFLMRGIVADKISTFNKIKDTYSFEMNMEAMVEYDKIIDEIITNVKKENASFFLDFKSNVQSGDHLLVGQALERGSAMLHYGILKSQTVSAYYSEALGIASQVSAKDLISPDGQLNIAKMKQIDDIIKRKFAENQLVSRTQACSLVAVCVVWIYVAAVQSAAVGVSVAAAVGVVVYAGAYLWTAATTWWYRNPDIEKEPEQVPTEPHIELQQELIIDEIAHKLVAE